MSLKKLKTRNVFLETQVFRSRNYSCSGETMRKVIDLASTQSIHIYMTDVTVGEIKAQIPRVAHAIPVVKQLQKESDLLWNIEGLTTAFKKLSRGEMGAEMLEAFEAFCKKVRVEIIPTSVGSIDAFPLSALDLYCTRQKIDAYIIDGDKGVREACKGHDKLFHIEKLEEFVDLVAREDALSELATEAFADVRGQLAGRIEEKFKDSAFYLDDVSGDVGDVTVTGIKLSEEYLIDVDQKQSTFHLFAEIEFDADVTYEKPGTGIWDNEHGRLISVDTIHKTVEGRYHDVKVSVTIALEKTDPKRSKIKEILLNRGEDFAIDILPTDMDLK